MDEFEERKQCDFCGEELGFSAYYQHLSDETGLVCPARFQTSQESNTSEFNFENGDDDIDSCEHDSSFDFGPESLMDIQSAINATTSSTVEESGDSSVMSFTSSSKNGEEI